MKKDLKINLYFEENGEDLQKIIDELILKIYIANQRVCINE